MQVRSGLWSHGVPYIEKFALVNSEGPNISPTLKQTKMKEGLKTKIPFFLQGTLLLLSPTQGTHNIQSHHVHSYLSQIFCF